LSEQPFESNLDNVSNSSIKPNSIASLPPGLFSDDDTLLGDESSIARPPRRKRRRVNWLLVAVALCLLVAYGFYVFLLPEIQTSFFRWRFPKKMLPAELGMAWSSRNLLRSCEFLFYCWFFYFGASIASFLNVVAWRMPQGKTIVFGGSKCPYCNTRLSFLDNTPVLGWLLVQGRCRTCRLPIAARYLIIEVVIGCVFVWLAVWELIRGGANLPHWDSLGKSGLTNMVFDPQWTLIVAALFHATMFAVLIMLAVANSGQKAFPVAPFLFIVGILASHKLFLPALDFVAWSEPFLRTRPVKLVPMVNTLISMGIGGLAGVGLGWISAWVAANREDSISRRHWILQCLLIGTILGWQSAVTIVFCSTLAIAALTKLGWINFEEPIDGKSIRSLRQSACLILICLIHHSLWRSIAYLLGIT
jgi:leader peptidase (prepilin peptidase) / N-methyltransferase